MQDVAQAVGVSTMTVSRALRQSSHVEPQLRQRIQATAQAMGYVPDPAARALASQKSTQVLVLLPSLANPRLAQLLEALHAVLYPAGYHTLIGITHDDSTHLHQLLQSYLPLRPAGLLLTGEIQHPQTRQLLASHPTPCVQMLAPPPCPDIPCVGFSPAAAGAAMTSHLLAQGRRRIAFAASQHHAHRMPLEQGWRHTLQAAGLYQAALALQHPAPASPDVGAQLLHTALAQAPDIDAIFFSDDLLAQGACLEALRMGIPIPGRLAIAGCHDLPGSAQMVPPLTTLRTPGAEIGSASAHMLLQLLRGEVPTPLQQDLGYELVVRAST